MKISYFRADKLVYSIQTVFLLIGSSILLSSSLPIVEYQITIKTVKYPIEDYWQISEIKLNGNKIEIHDYEAISRSMYNLKVKESGIYEFIFQSIFGNSITKTVKVGPKNKTTEVEYPKFKNKIGKYSKIDKSILTKSNKIQIAKISWGCFGVHQSYFTISKKGDGGMVYIKTINGRAKKIMLTQVEYLNMMNAFLLKKKDKPFWGSTNKSYYYFKIGEQIITAKEKNFQMKDLELQLRQIQK